MIQIPPYKGVRRKGNAMISENINNNVTIAEKIILKVSRKSWRSAQAKQELHNKLAAYTNTEKEVTKTCIPLLFMYSFFDLFTHWYRFGNPWLLYEELQ